MNDFYVNYNTIMVPFYDVNTNSGIDNAIRHNMSLFPEGIIFELIRPRDIVYDIGAYTGTHSILFALMGCEVYSFEPSPFNYPRCVKNCLPFRQIHVFDVAFHEKEYEISTQFKDCNNFYPDNNDREQFIKYHRFDNFIEQNKLPLPDFIKMDVEGMETILFKTFDLLLSQNKTIIYVERHKKLKNGSDLQNYPDNPNWLFVEEGGYDFNELKKYNCEFYNFGHDLFLKKININIDLNELDEALVIIPKNKIDIINKTQLKVINMDVL